MPYRYLWKIETGDAAFEPECRILEELFREAAWLYIQLMSPLLPFEETGLQLEIP
jgi:hypothetical protein